MKRIKPNPLADETYQLRVKLQVSEINVKHLMSKNAQLVESLNRLQWQSSVAQQQIQESYMAGLRIVEDSSAKVMFYEQQVNSLRRANKSLNAKLQDFSQCQESITKLKKDKAELVSDKLLADKTASELQHTQSELVAKEQAKSQALVSQLSGMQTKLDHSERIVAQLKKGQKTINKSLFQVHLQLANEREMNQASTGRLAANVKDLEITRGKLISILKSSSEQVDEISAMMSKLDESLESRAAVMLSLQQVQEDLRTVVSPGVDLEKSLFSADSRGLNPCETLCPICLMGRAELDSSNTRLMALASCGHVLCSECLESQSRIRQCCPMCQTSFKNSHKIKLYLQ
ncbi:hypothetical protein HDE_06486 [Halotydeus destructor]|nr:hypothetical protein HDE_06486 [Halotydeus destructor]